MKKGTGQIKREALERFGRFVDLKEQLRDEPICGCGQCPVTFRDLELVVRLFTSDRKVTLEDREMDRISAIGIRIRTKKAQLV